jgi:glutamyl-Q tRNA(Asp) synthetase
MEGPTAPPQKVIARDAPYRGRFAPSPTGPLHFGSLVAALGSYLDARAYGGAWLVRMEDLDRPREVPGAADAILRALDSFGFEWDGQILYQSSRTDAYAEAIGSLRGSGLVFPCGCSRREIAAHGPPGAHGPVYPGTCRDRLPPGRKERSLRLRTESRPILIRDRIQGELRQDLEREVGDFVVRRADGIHAYQLAVVVDDAFQGVTQVVRGADLMCSTPRQVYLHQALASRVPAYAHLPLAVDNAGRKLSKSDAAAPVDPSDPMPALIQAWRFLGQEAFAEQPGSLTELWTQARAAWDTNRVPRSGFGTLPAG